VLFEGACYACDEEALYVCLDTVSQGKRRAYVNQGPMYRISVHWECILRRRAVYVMRRPCMYVIIGCQKGNVWRGRVLCYIIKWCGRKMYGRMGAMCMNW